MSRLTAAADQLGAAWASMAPALAQYRDALLAAGFTRDEAFVLCQGMQENLMAEEVA